MENAAESRKYIDQLWAEAMVLYRGGKIRLTLTKETEQYMKELQKEFMPEDTKAGLIEAYLEKFTGKQVCSKQLYKEALNHAFNEPQQWELREINEIMNHSVKGWKQFSNPRYFGSYGRQRGWERDNQSVATEENSMVDL